MILTWLIVFVLSLAILVKSAKWFVRGAEKIGLLLGMSPFVIGATIVAIGTSLPELVSSIIATLHGRTELVAANVIGSNIGNILLILGMASVAANGMILKNDSSEIDIFVLCVSTVLLTIVIFDGIISPTEGSILLSIYIAYVVYKTNNAEDESQIIKKDALPPTFQITKELGYLALGLVGLCFGADYTVKAIVKLSELLSIPGSLIAITALAVGTSLPELVVSIKTALEKKPEIAIGNILGSNVFNALAITGIPSLISPLKVDNITLTIGMTFFLLSALILIASWFYGNIKRSHGFGYLTLFTAFLLILVKSIPR